MHYRTLGRTGLRVSAVAFGAGPVSGLMTGDDHAAQAAALRRAIELGINWIDTAPGYGQGKSEANIGRALAEIHGTRITSRRHQGPPDARTSFPTSAMQFGVGRSEPGAARRCRR